MHRFKYYTTDSLYTVLLIFKSVQFYFILFFYQEVKTSGRHSGIRSCKQISVHEIMTTILVIFLFRALSVGMEHVAGIHQVAWIPSGTYLFHYLPTSGDRAWVA